jgi:hypothetical protein
MLDNRKILEGCSIDVDRDGDVDNITIDRISESIGNVGSFSISKQASKGKRKQTNKRETELPNNRKIDFSSIVSLNNNNQTQFTMGIEIHRRNKGNMAFRLVDYDVPIFMSNNAEIKTYEVALVRWDVKNDENKFLSTFGLPADMCDENVAQNLVGTTPLWSAQFFWTIMLMF